MKFGQLVECNMTNIFLEKSYTKCDRETSPTSFSEKKKKIDHMSRSIVWGFTKLVFIVCQVEGYWNILKLSWIKGGLGLVSLSHFPHNLKKKKNLKKNIFLVTFY